MSTVKSEQAGGQKPEVKIQLRFYNPLMIVVDQEGMDDCSLQIVIIQNHRKIVDSQPHNHATPPLKLFTKLRMNVQAVSNFYILLLIDNCFQDTNAIPRMQVYER